MPKIRLTEQAVKKIKRPKPTDFFDRDYPRLVLRVSPGGTKTWRVLHYIRSPKTQKMIPRTVKLGRYPDLGVKEARDRARKFDPKAEAAMPENSRISGRRLRGNRQCPSDRVGPIRLEAALRPSVVTVSECVLLHTLDDLPRLYSKSHGPIPLSIGSLLIMLGIQYGY